MICGLISILSCAMARSPNGPGHYSTIDGEMEGDATARQAKVVADFAKIVAGTDSEMKERYGM
jgi:hypothetical protein